MKMSDVFELPMQAEGFQLRDEASHYRWLAEFSDHESNGKDSEELARSAAHAINCHDELVGALNLIVQMNVNHVVLEVALKALAKSK